MCDWLYSARCPLWYAPNRCPWKVRDMRDPDEAKRALREHVLTHAEGQVSVYEAPRQKSWAPWL